uniref:Uncharacterized protein n=1 Tax=Micrurus corallinus TaxID=54390 RepID=A0A2D4G2M1_MICCO
MAENKERKPKNADVRPKTSRSRSADRKDGYVWSGKKLSWIKKNENSSNAEIANASGIPTLSLRDQERKQSCSSAEMELEHILCSLNYLNSNPSDSVAKDVFGRICKAL